MILWKSMKNALLLPLRYVITLLITMALTIAVAFALFKAQGAAFTPALSGAFARMTELFPFLGLCALFLSSFAPLRRPGNMILSFIFLFAISAASIYFGSLGLDRSIRSFKEQIEAPPVRTPAGVIIRESDRKASYAVSVEPGGARFTDVVIADFGPGETSPGKVILYAPTRPIAEVSSPPIKPPPLLVSLSREAAAARNFISSGKGFVPDLIAAACMAFFFASLWIFCRLPSWALAGVFLSLAAFTGALWLLSAIVSRDFASLVGTIIPPAAAAWAPHAAMGIAGAFLVAWDAILAVSRRKRAGAKE